LMVDHDPLIDLFQNLGQSLKASGTRVELV
jgi:hypothetical protein